jgi:hypothetical protein
MPSRRSALRAAATAATAAVAGCSTLVGDGGDATTSRPTLEVFLANELPTDATITVSAFRGDERLFEHTYHLEAGHGDESQTVVGIPTAVRVGVDGGRSTAVSFSTPADCDDPEINVWVEPDVISVNNGCVQ